MAETRRNVKLHAPRGLGMLGWSCRYGFCHKADDLREAEEYVSTGDPACHDNDGVCQPSSQICNDIC